MSAPSPEDFRRIGEVVDLHRIVSDPEGAGEEAESDAAGQTTLAFFRGVQGLAPDETDHEIRIDRQETEDEDQLLETHADRLKAVVTDVRMQLNVNRESGSSPIYAGFEFVPTNQTPSADESAYVGAFLPLGVAAKFPELLLSTTITFDEVYCSDKLPRGMRVVVRPGVFRTLGRNRFTDVFGSAIALCLYLLAMGGGALYLAGRFLR